MDYQKIYNSLIITRKLRIVNKTTLYEKHHIIPKSLGGNNLKDNIVHLTPKEHYIAHLLLVEIYPDSNKMKFALWSLCNTKNYRYKPSARVYGRIRTEYMKTVRGENHPLYRKKRREEDIKKCAEGRCKEIHQFDLDGNFIKTWKSTKIAALELNLHPSNITRALLSKQPSTCGGFIWKHSKEELFQIKYRSLKKISVPKIGPFRKRVIQISKDNVILQVWPSICEASRTLNICKGDIIKCCKKQYKTAGKFKWVYEELA